jgi:hypothetical protein
MMSRKADAVIGDGATPYLLRWYLIPRNKVFNVYLHLFLRSDDDRALHDHPWWNMSVLLYGEYWEHTIAAGGINKRVRRSAGDWKLRWARDAHRIEVKAPCYTLFITGPRIREWGFHCPKKGWVLWTDFVRKDDIGKIGKGCDD